LAKAADHGEQLPDEPIISFEDPADVMKVITAARLALFRTVK
jgi:predicted transcriptional regulator